MQFIYSKSIILQTTQIKDFKYLLKLYTENSGLITADAEINNFIQPALIHPYNICEVQIFKNKYKKFSVKEIKPIYIYKNLFHNYSLNTIGQFISEVLLKTIKDDLADIKLFQFITQMFMQLDSISQDKIPFFHLYFLRDYIETSGYLPANNFSSQYPYFNLKEGRFTDIFDNNSVSKEDAQYLYQLFFDDTFIINEKFPLFRITHCLLDYLKYHSGLKEVQSLTFLKDALLQFETK